MDWYTTMWNIMNIRSDSVEQTKNIGAIVGRSLRGGEVIELVSDVGGGKTTLTKGIAAGLDVADTVQSPTFTISRLYHARDGLELHHFDFYRLHDAGIMAAELAESLTQANTIVVVEWADVVSDVLPDAKIRIEITAVDEDSRLLRLDIPASMDYVLAALASYKETKDIA